MAIGRMGKKKALNIIHKRRKIPIFIEVSVYMVNAFVKDFEPEFKVLKKKSLISKNQKN